MTSESWSLDLVLENLYLDFWVGQLVLKQFLMVLFFTGPCLLLDWFLKCYLFAWFYSIIMMMLEC